MSNARIRRFALFLLIGELRRKRFQGFRRFIRLTKCDVKGDDATAIFADIVEQPREMKPRKRPVTEGFLRLLVDVDDDDPRIRFRPPAHLKTIIEATELQSIDEVENRSWPLAQKRRGVDRNRSESHNQADGERTLVAPPFPKNPDQFLTGFVRHTCRENELRPM